MPISDELDRRLHTAAFIEVRRMLELRDPLTASDLARGFQFEGQRIPLINPQLGIFKPHPLDLAALSFLGLHALAGLRPGGTPAQAVSQALWRALEFVGSSCFPGLHPRCGDLRLSETPPSHGRGDDRIERQGLR